MSPLQVHLVVNHVPLFAAAMGVAAMAWSMVRKSREMGAAALALFLLTAASATIASQSGDEAEDVLEDRIEQSDPYLLGVQESAIEAHEEAAEAATAMALTLAGGVALLLLVRRMWPRFGKAAEGLLLVMGIVTTAAMVRVGALGGDIRHTELRHTEAVNSPR
jgi:peptidoglycan/LPS O-acetylase OafA/YrhL